MRTLAKLALILVFAPMLLGCEDEESGGSSTYYSSRDTELRSQLSAERAARARLEHQLAQERTARERERRRARARLGQEEQKSTLGGVIAVVLACLVTAVVVLMARERRIRSTLTLALRRVLGRRRHHVR